MKSKDIVHKYLSEHNCDVITKEDCISICQLGKELILGEIIIIDIY